MSTKRQVIAVANIRARLPLAGPLALGLALDRIGAPGWMWGACAVLVLLWWVAVLASWRSTEQVDVLQVTRDLAEVAVYQSEQIRQGEWPKEVKEVEH